MHRNITTASFALLSYVAAPALAADDVKAYHGSICQLRASGNDVDVVYGGRLESDHVGVFCSSSFSGSSCPVVCPLVRDKIDDDGSLEQITIEFNNGGPPPTTLSCTAYTQQEDTSGSVLDSQQYQTTTAGTGSFTWTELASTTGNEGSYAVECDLNYYDEIYHIYVRETTDTGATE